MSYSDTPEHKANDTQTTNNFELSRKQLRNTQHRMNSVLRLIWEGVYDDGSSLSLLRGTPHVVEDIWKLVEGYWKSLIKLGSITPISSPNGMAPGSFKFISQDRFFLEVKAVLFPKPQGLNINMMPFVLDRTFERCCLPDNILPYWRNFIRPLFDCCIFDAKSEEGKVCYLTIHESQVKCEGTQMRPGVHTDNPGTIIIEGNENHIKDRPNAIKSVSKGKGSSYVRFYEHHLGCGVTMSRNQVKGGIYMASNVENSCEVWNSQVQCDTSKNREIIGKRGNIEYLREYLGDSTVMKANTIYWITDRTPHESLKLTNIAYRQYFRLVTHCVSLLHEDHSTKNPFGIVPDKSITMIVRGSKFGDTDQVKIIDTPSRSTKRK